MPRSRPLAALVALAAATAPAAALAAPTATGSPASVSVDGTAKALGLTSGERLVQRSRTTTPDGVTHTRYDRTVDGLPVIGGDVIVHAKDGQVQRTTWGRGRLVAVASRTPKVGAATAAATARTRLAAGTTATTTSSLAVYLTEKGPRLAHDVVAEGLEADGTPTRLHVVVDAQDGTVLDGYDEIVAEGTGTGVMVGPVTVGTTGTGPFALDDGIGHQTFDLGGATTGTGTLMTDADNVWGDGTATNRQSAAVDAQYGAEKTYDYYLTNFGRRGIWDTGKGAPSRVHYGSAYNNAFWDGTQMTYGDGTGNVHPLTELDVAGHEMSHGVTENTAGLIYRGDAGGLNEATSDIFGTMVEFYANNATDTPDYFMGEKIDLRGNGTPLRYMDKPSKDGSSADCYSSKVARLDPHYSSGPLNHWFYLASEGSGAKTINGVAYSSPTCNAKTVTGAGNTVAAKVWYNTLVNELTSRSTYGDARDGAIRQAKALYDRGSAQCASIEAAFDGIAVPKGTQTCTN